MVKVGSKICLNQKSTGWTIDVALGRSGRCDADVEEEGLSFNRTDQTTVTYSQVTDLRPLIAAVVNA